MPMADFKAFFLSGTRNLERDCLSHMKLRAESNPPAKMKREVRGSKRMRERRAMRRERKRISCGILRRILSSTEGSDLDIGHFLSHRLLRFHLFSFYIKHF